LWAGKKPFKIAAEPARSKAHRAFAVIIFSASLNFSEAEKSEGPR
jgi:hypothetical protein